MKAKLKSIYITCDDLVEMVFMTTKSQLKGIVFGGIDYELDIKPDVSESIPDAKTRPMSKHETR